MIRMATQTAGIRNYEARDAPEIVQLFFKTVRSVNRAHYSEEQVKAWAPEVPDPEEWHSRMAGRRTLVAEEGGGVVGFAELEDDGHLDTLSARGYSRPGHRPAALRGSRVGGLGPRQ